MQDTTPPPNQQIKTIGIEISGCCNAKCKYCCSGQGLHKTQNKFMNAELFEKIVQKLGSLGFLKEVKTIFLYNWGEPFLNPQLNEILSILGKYNLKARISSNFIKKPNIHPENYQFIDYVIFSISSLKRERYKRIYGADLEKTLANFDYFIEEKNKRNGRIRVFVNFHKYLFNKDEFNDARDYFKMRDADINDNYYAYINDGHASIEYVKTGKLYGYEEAEKDLDLERFKFVLSKCENKPCYMKEQIVINESGNLTLCCAVTSQDKEYNLGNILELSREEIFRLKNAPLCKTCQELKLADLFGKWGNYFYRGFEISSKLLNGRKFVVWGTGTDAKNCLSDSKFFTDIDFFVSKDFNEKPLFFGKQVLSKNCLDKKKHFVLILSSKFGREIEKELIDMGFGNEDMLNYIPS